MTSPVFKKTIFISLLGHLTVFGIFSLSFGNRLPVPGSQAQVYFFGQFLSSSQLNQPIAMEKELFNFFTRRPDAAALNKITQESALLSRYSAKPAVVLTFNTEKEIFIEQPPSIFFPPRRREPAIILHPLLPYGFTLYFKDRQLAHVELMFKIVPTRERNSIVVKRKISSGNLEVDLLSMRYIGHYLFIQQASFTPNKWQTVKIDLSAKDD